MALPLPRILCAVPQTWQAHLEIAKAIRTLAEQGEPERLQKREEVEASASIHEIAEEIAREFLRELRKAGFNPNEPRVSAGNSGGGQWTSEGGSSNATDPRVLSDATPDNNWKPGARFAANDPPGIGHNQGPPLEEPPQIPLSPPSKLSTFVKAAAYWLASAIARLDKRVALFLAALQAAQWLAEAYRYIIAYQDPPKTMEELQQNRGPGYDRHHIVEQWSEDDGMPRSKIDAPDNIVPIPTLKHWQINSWLSKPSEQFKDAKGNKMSPRDYMKGKTWEERYQFGLDVLRKFGVLKP